MKHKSNVWQYFTKTSSTGFLCKFCEKKFFKNATRMRRHLARCLNCPTDIKDEFKSQEMLQRAGGYTKLEEYIKKDMFRKPTKLTKAVTPDDTKK